MKRIITIDPGNRHVGVATWDERGGFIFAMETTPDKVVEFIKRTHERYEVAHVVIESYVLYGDKAKTQIGSKMETPRLIGALYQVCQDLGITASEQQASFRKVALASPFARTHETSYGRPRSRHAWDAVLHGIYFFHFGKKRKENDKARSNRFKAQRKAR